MNNLELPDCVGCKDLHCTKHAESIENYTLNIMETIENTAAKFIPSVGGCTKSKMKEKIPGWNLHIRPFYEESRFWHEVWISAGRPVDGELAHIMRYSKHQFKYALRRVTRAAEKLQNDIFINGIMKGDVDIFK